MKIKRHTQFLTLLSSIIVHLFSLSCGEAQTTNAILQEAESLVENAPDSAYMILKNAGSTADFSLAQRAEWNLLITRAMDKAKIKSPNDSIIREAVAYYKEKNNPRQLMLSYYYIARVNRELGDAPRAQEYYLNARKTAFFLKDSHYIPRISSNIGMLYNYQELPAMAIPYFLEAKEYLIQQNDSANISYTMRDLGRAYNLLHKVDSAILFYEKALIFAKKHQRLPLLSEMAHIYINEEDLTSVSGYIEEIKSYYSSSDQSNLVIGQYYTKTDKPDSARYYLKKCIDSENIHTRAAAVYYLYQLSKGEKDYENYTFYQTQYELLHDSISEGVHTGELLRLKTLYNYEEKENKLIQEELAHEAARKKNQLLIFIAALSVLLVLYIYSRLLKNGKLLKEQQLRWVQVEKQQEDIDKLQERFTSQIEKLKKENEEMEYRLFSREVNDAELVSSAIYLKIHNPAKDKVTSEEKTEFMDLMDKVYPFFRTSLLQLRPTLDETELLLCYLVKANVKPKDMATILEKNEIYISSKRRRLAESMFATKKSTLAFDERIKKLN